MRVGDRSASLRRFRMIVEKDENGGLKTRASDEAGAGEFVRDGDGALLGLMEEADRVRELLAGIVC